jgi:putative flippase GtrA
MHSEQQRIVRYLMVGAVGFVVDAGLLALQVHLFGVNPYVARGPSFLVAATVTWLLNRVHTFKGLERYSTGNEYRRYIMIQMAGALINLGVYVMAIASFAICARYPELGVAMGAVVGPVANYILARLFVFPGSKR